MDYEKKYKDALERAEEIIRYYKEHNRGDETSIEDLEQIFPELKESEDEKIRKRLLTDFSVIGKEKWGGLKVKDICAWLEKQGEQKSILDFKARNWYVSKVDGKIHDLTYNPTDKVGPKFKVGDKLISTKNPHLTYEIFGIEENELGELDYNVIIYTDGKCAVYNKLSCKKVDSWGELVKEKPAWSEEDSKRIDRICDFIWKNRKGDTDEIYQQELDINWLKSLKHRVQPKQIWSEEDEEELNYVIDTIGSVATISKVKEYRDILYKNIDWLKSIKQRLEEK